AKSQFGPIMITMVGLTYSWAGSELPADCTAIAETELSRKLAPKQGLSESVSFARERIGAISTATAILTFTLRTSTDHPSSFVIIETGPLLMWLQRWGLRNQKSAFPAGFGITITTAGSIFSPPVTNAL